MPARTWETLGAHDSVSRHAYGGEPTSAGPDGRCARYIEQGGLTTLSSVRLRVVLAAATLVSALAAPAPTVLAAQGLSLTTPYPAVTASPGFAGELRPVRGRTEAGRIDLEVTGIPASWSASLHGGGLVVRAAHLDGSDPTEVRLDVDVPADATGTTRITVVASERSRGSSCPWTSPSRRRPRATSPSTPDFPALRGAAGTTFTFNLTIDNDTVART